MINLIKNKTPEAETKAGTGFAGVKDYRLTYYTPDYQVKDTDILAAFRMSPRCTCRRSWCCSSSRIINRYLDFLTVTKDVVMILNQLLVKITNILLTLHTL
jgi:hypothetical protein